MNPKVDFQCTHCPKVLKNPINLPCDCGIICEKHLRDEDVLKANVIKCKICKKDFSLTGSVFVANRRLQNMLNNEVHLTSVEKNVKSSLNDSIKVIFELKNQFEKNKNMAVTASFEFFQELRRNIDLQKELLNCKIEEVYFDMIAAAKVTESLYNKHFDVINPKLDLNTSLNEEVLSLEETFRNVDLSLDSIKQMESNQIKSISEIKSKMHDLARVRSFLIRVNFFKPNILFNPESFGFLKLNGFEKNELSSSQILGSHRYLGLIQLCEFPYESQWKLVYRASRDGFDSSAFHLKCDLLSPTLTILKAKDSGFIFGGYTVANWAGEEVQKLDPHAFIFSLTNGDDKPCLMKTSNSINSIFCSSETGPSFGTGEVHIESNSNLKSQFQSFSDLGDTYKHPEYEYGTFKARTFLAGSFFFQLDEMEVYHKN